MSYIVPMDLPDSCSNCRFSTCKFSHPFWSREKPNRKAYMCQADKERRTIEMEFDDETTKAKWCPLIGLYESEEEK